MRILCLISESKCMFRCRRLFSSFCNSFEIFFLTLTNLQHDDIVVVDNEFRETKKGHDGVSIHELFAENH